MMEDICEQLNVSIVTVIEKIGGCGMTENEAKNYIESYIKFF